MAKIEKCSGRRRNIFLFAKIEKYFAKRNIPECSEMMTEMMTNYKIRQITRKHQDPQPRRAVLQAAPKCIGKCMPAGFFRNQLELGSFIPQLCSGTYLLEGKNGNTPLEHGLDPCSQICWRAFLSQIWRKQLEDRFYSPIYFDEEEPTRAKPQSGFRHCTEVRWRQYVRQQRLPLPRENRR